jgi:hypothetical protein
MIFLLPETSRSIVGNGSIRPARYLRLPIPGLMRHWNESDVAEVHNWRIPNASLSILFIEIYKLNQWQAGLIYLPFGIGGTVSTFFSGALLNNAYRNARTARGLSTDKAVGDDLDNFSVEKARLTVIWIPMLLTACSVLAFGWVLHFHLVKSPSSLIILKLTLDST